MVAGRNSVVESLRAGMPAMALYVAGRSQEDERVAEAVQLASDAGIAVLEAGLPELDRMTGGAIHQGVALRVRPYEYAHPEEFTERLGATLPLIVALDGVTDPRNLGAIARVCEVLGADGLIVPRHGSAGVTAVVARASAGAVEHLPIAMVTNVAETLRRARRPDLWSYAAEAEGGSPPWGLDFRGGTVLVLGSEGGNPFPGLAQDRPGWAPAPLTDVHIGGAVMWVGGAGIMFGLVLAVFFAWSREKREDGGLGWLESARRSNFDTIVSSHQDGGTRPGPGPGRAPAAAPAGTPAGRGESVDDDEHLAAYNAYLARLNQQHDR